MRPDELSDAEPTVRFHRVYPAAVAPMRADKSALGLMPTMAFRHCEPMRMASSFGWYIFPPEDVYLKFNGADTFHCGADGEWQPLQRAELPGFNAYWDQHAPEALQGLAPAWISRLQLPGLVQIWSGLLCATQPGWSVLVRPLVNQRNSFLFAPFEGLVEADRFQPFPLFTNIQLIATDTVIHLPKLVPLFQVQPLRRETYGEQAHRFAEHVGLSAADNEGRPPMRPEDWDGYRKTIRAETPDYLSEPAQYTGNTRKRSKHEE